MDKKFSFIIIGLLLLILILIGVFYFIKMNKSDSPGSDNLRNVSVNNSGVSNPASVPNVTNSSNTNTSRNAGVSSGGKLAPKDISKSVDIANSSNGTGTITNSTVVGTNISIVYTQNVTNITAEKKAAESWCVMGSPMNSAKVSNSNEWIVADMKYYSGKLYCYASKSGSSTNYLFNEGYSVVYSVEGTDRPTYTLIP